MKKLPLALLFVILILSCRDDSQFDQKTLASANPTEYTFQLPIDSLKGNILMYFHAADYIGTNETYKKVFAFETESNVKMPVLFTPETKQNAVFARKWFDEAGAENQIFLYNDGTTWPSALHFSKGSALPFRTSFVLTLTPVSDAETKVSIKAERPVVIQGQECCGSHGPYGKEHPVPPTSIEEYTLLLFIGEQLGLKMPPLNSQTVD